MPGADAAAVAAAAAAEDVGPRTAWMSWSLLAASPEQFHACTMRLDSCGAKWRAKCAWTSATRALLPAIACAGAVEKGEAEAAPQASEGGPGEEAEAEAGEEGCIMHTTCKEGAATRSREARERRLAESSPRPSRLLPPSLAAAGCAAPSPSSGGAAAAAASGALDRCISPHRSIMAATLSGRLEHSSASAAPALLLAQSSSLSKDGGIAAAESMTHTMRCSRGRIESNCERTEAPQGSPGVSTHTTWTGGVAAPEPEPQPEPEPAGTGTGPQNSWKQLVGGGRGAEHGAEDAPVGAADKCARMECKRVDLPAPRSPNTPTHRLSAMVDGWASSAWSCCALCHTTPRCCFSSDGGGCRISEAPQPMTILVPMLCSLMKKEERRRVRREETKAERNRLRETMRNAKTKTNLW